MDDKQLQPYRENYSEDGLWKTLQKHAKRLGVKTVYTILLFFYAFKRKDTPRWAKNIIIGVLGYLITPIDLLPDLTPIIGYTDDIGMLSLGLVAIAAHINKEVRQQAREKLGQWFGKFDETVLKPIDDKL
jgi:uncharacterized membrane protein YkvA (DUF1232 family)